MRTGLYISGAGHALLILWLLFGSLIGWRNDEVKLRVSDVSFISEDEFAAMTAPRGEAAAPANPPAPAPAAPVESPVPAPRPEPDPAPIPEPEPVPEPEPAPTPEATPQDAPRVASEVAPKPDPSAEVAPEVVDAPAPEPVPEAAPVEEVIPTAPQEATTEIVTEAEEPDTATAAAPVSSPRPTARPARLDRPKPPAPETPQDTPVETPPTPNTSAANAVANALSDAIAGGESERPALDVPEGPPLTRGEKEGLRLAVKQCWNLGSTSSDALRTTVVVLVDMDRTGKPGTIRMVDWDGPSRGAADIAYQAARRAILICGRSGYDLPADKYGQWRQIEMTFNPDKMRIK